MGCSGELSEVDYVASVVRQTGGIVVAGHVGVRAMSTGGKQEKSAENGILVCTQRGVAYEAVSSTSCPCQCGPFFMSGPPPFQHTHGSQLYQVMGGGESTVAVASYRKREEESRRSESWTKR